MRVLVYDPYLDTLGGGERYTLSVARVLADLGYEVDVVWDDVEILGKLVERFGMDVTGIRVRENFSKQDIFEKWRLMREYDLSFWVSDGSVPFLFAKKNWLHFQVPFQGVGGRSLLNRLKLGRVDAVVCNSELTKGVIDREYGVEGVVVYPPVAVDKFKPGRKEKLILCVGRFSQLKQAKRQDVLIEVFSAMVDDGLSGWRLVLAGGSEVGKGEYFEGLVKRAKGYPIEIVEDLSFDKLKDLYGRARIFWSAAGYGVDEEREPEKLEHFGIAVVEGMAAGVVPVVFWAGGHKEIVRRGESGEGWREKEELIEVTRSLMGNQRKWRRYSLNGTCEAQRFSELNFQNKIEGLLE